MYRFQTADPTFHEPVVGPIVADYKEVVLHPMDFKTMEEKANLHQYKSVDEFLVDINWIVHNCYIYNSHNHPLTANAKQFYKLIHSMIVDLEICPDCFKNFHIKPDTWFVEVCRKPHGVVWAKLTGMPPLNQLRIYSNVYAFIVFAGHPFWPGKVVRLSTNKKEADVRFFGAHDR